MEWDLSPTSNAPQGVKEDEEGYIFTFTDVNFTNSGDNYFSFFTETTEIGDNDSEERNKWDYIGTRYGAESDGTLITTDTPATLQQGGNAFKIAKGTYTITVDLATMTVSVSGAAASETEELTVPDELYIVGNIEDHSWDTKNALQATTKNGNTFTFTDVKFVASNATDRDFSSYFSFISQRDADGEWNNVGTRYGSAVQGDQPISIGDPEAFAANSNAFKIDTYGTYSITVDFDDKMVTITDGTPGEIPAEEMPPYNYIVGNINGHSWDISSTAVLATSTEGTTALFEGVELVKSGTDEDALAYFTFITATSEKSDWDEVNGSTRYGAPSLNLKLSSTGDTAPLAKYGTNPGAALNFSIEAGTYDITLDFAAMTVTITPVETETHYTPVINGSGTVKLKGWTGTQNWGGGWEGSEADFVNLTKESDSCYYLDFPAEAEDAYIALRDSEGTWFYGSANSTVLSVDESMTEFKTGGDMNNRTQLAGMTVGHNYRLSISADDDDTVTLSLTDLGERHAAPDIEVATITEDDGTYAGEFTISVTTLKANGSILYSINGGTPMRLYIGDYANPEGTVKVYSTCTLTAWTVEGDLTGDVATASWENPSDVKNPVTKVELLDNSDGGTGAVELTLTNTSGTTWAGRYAFPRANNNDWNNYYYLRLTYLDESVRYAYLGGIGLINIDLDETYTTDTATNPYLTTSADKLNGKHTSPATSAGFGVNGANDRTLVLTITLSDDHLDVTSLKVTEPEVVNPLPTTPWSLEDPSVWGDETKKYFYISWNQNDNRVSPEWELEKTGDDTYELKNFMVIPNGQFRIREIERNGNSDGTHKVTDYGWEDAANYTIGLGALSGISAESVIGTDGFTGDGIYSGTATMNADVKRGFRWDVGFSIASIEFKPSTRALTFSIDLTQPSTLSQASKPGIPYVALMGSNVKVPLAEDQAMSFALTLDNGVENTAYTNAWLQYDSEGNLYVYDDLGANASAYCVGTEGDVASSGTPAEGQAMNSTRVPPVHLITFAQELPDGSTSTFTSKDITFTYQGVVSDVEGTINGVTATVDSDLAAASGIPGTASGTKYAAYTIESINLEGLFKIFNGYGAHSYGSSVNGLSFFANWGVGEMPSSNVYAYDNAQDGTFVPLSGGGTKVDSTGSTSRGSDGKDDGTANNTYEDNVAGKYINFPSRSYVWKATFYYALEDDKLESSVGDHYAGNDCYESYLNTGRDFSWIHFNFSNAPATIELDLEGTDRGKAIWSINAANDQDVIVTSYEVKVYPVNSDGSYDTSATSYELVDGSFEDPNGTTAFIAEGTSSVTKTQLPVGRYIAVMTYSVKLDGSDEAETREIASNIISVFSVDLKPVISVRQQMNGSAYTFDAVIRTNVNAIYEDYMTKALEAGTSASDITPANFEGTVKLPWSYEDCGSPVVYIEDETGNWVAIDDYASAHTNFSYTEDKQNSSMSVTFGEGTFSDDDDEDELYFPRIRVLDYVPLSTYDFSITVPEGIYNLTEEKTATASLLIQAPKYRYEGAPSIYKDPMYRFNAVIIDGYFVEVNGASLSDGNTGNTQDTRFDTARRWYTIKMLWVVYTDDEGEQRLRADRIYDGIQYDGFITEGLPYIAKLNEDGNYERCDQTYNFETQTFYFNMGTYASNENNPSEAVASTIVMESHDLNAPRTGLSDKQPLTMLSHFNDAGITGWKTDGTATAADFVTIVDNYSESYGGANRIVEDAYIALQLTLPSDLHYDVKLSDMKMTHHPNSHFHPDNHHKAETGSTVASEHAPGYKYVTSESHLTDLSEGRVWWASNVDPAKSVVKKDFEERYYRNFNGSVKVTADQLTEPDSFWAGCPEEVTDTPDGSATTFTAGDVTFNRLDHANGLYGTRNHHTRAGWQGGELMSLTFFRMMFGSGIDTSTGKITGLNYIDGENPVFESTAKANDYLTKLTSFVTKGTNLEDSELINQYPDNQNEEEAMEDSGADFVETMFLNADNYMTGPYAMMRVCHVNHESWWASAYGADVARQWFGAYNLSYPDFNHVVDEMIKFPTEYYTPVAYDLSYRYPFLKVYNVNYVGGTIVDTSSEAYSSEAYSLEATDINVTQRTKRSDSYDSVSDDDLNVIVARSTGLVAFDATATPATSIVTALGEVEADAPAAPAAITISYDGATGIATVNAPAEVKAINVYDISGKRFAAAVTLRGTTATADLSRLAPGVYTVQAVTATASRTIKLRK